MSYYVIYRSSLLGNIMYAKAVYPERGGFDWVVDIAHATDFRSRENASLWCQDVASDHDWTIVTSEELTVILVMES